MLVINNYQQTLYPLVSDVNNVTLIIVKNV